MAQFSCIQLGGTIEKFDDKEILELTLLSKYGKDIVNQLFEKNIALWVGDNLLIHNFFVFQNKAIEICLN